MAEGRECNGGDFESVSRRQFMLLAGGSAAAATFLAACGDSGGDSETSQFGDGDVGILNYALTLEYLTTAFYAGVVKSGLFKGPELTTMRKFGEQEAEHVTALAKAVERLGGDPAERPKTGFPLQDARSALALAGTLENLSAAAYLGQVPKIENTAALTTALTIHTVEGKHAATINTLLGQPIAPEGPFAKPASAKAVLRSVEPFIVG